MMSLYLIAILPPPEIDLKVSTWKGYMLNRYGCRVAMKSPAHITLIPPFHFKDEQAELLKDFLAAFTKNATGFPIELQNFAAFPPRVIFVQVQANEKLAVLKHSLEQEMISNGYPVKTENRPFHPHVTIANRDLSKQDFPEAWQYFKNLSYKASFKAEAITLLKHDGQTWNRFADATLPEK
jgi:2'-5' RNA ligase